MHTQWFFTVVLAAAFFAPAVPSQASDLTPIRPASAISIPADAGDISIEEYLRSLPPLLTERWFKVTTDHLVLYGTLGRPEMRRLATELETLRQVALAVLPNPRVDDSEKLLVFAMSSTEEFEKYGLVEQTITEDADFETGRAHVHPAWPAIVMLHQGSRATRHLAFRAYARHLAGRATPFLPPWLAEGLTDYLSTFTLSKKGEIGLGGPNNQRLQALQDATALPSMANVIATRTFEGSGRRLDQLHAVSWLFAQYAAHGDADLSRKIPEFLARQGAGQPLQASFGASFGRSPKTMDEELAEYLSADAYGALKFRLREPADPNEVEVERADVVELGRALASVHTVFGERWDVALRLWTRVKKKAPGDPRAAAALALLDEETVGGSTPGLEAAVEAAPTDPLVLWSAASMAVRATVEGEADASEQVRRTAELCASALDASPQDTRLAYECGWWAAEHSTALPEATQALERALALRPDARRTALALQRLYALQGRAEAAWAVHTRLLAPLGTERIAKDSLKFAVAAERSELDAVAAAGKSISARCERIAPRKDQLWVELHAERCEGRDEAEDGPAAPSVNPK